MSPPVPGDQKRSYLDATLLTLSLFTLVAGAAIFWNARNERVLHEAEEGSLRLRMEHAEWVRDGMLHPGTDAFPMPSAMTPGLPEDGAHRLNVELTVYNASASPQSFALSELSLQSDSGARWEAAKEESPRVTLLAAQSYAAVVRFDVPKEEAGALTLWWSRGGSRARMLSTVAPIHDEEAPKKVDWPKLASALPAGREAEGRLLFQSKFACASCHGDPSVPGSNNLGPSLADFARSGGVRVPGMDAQQYAYESIRTPNAFIAPLCAKDLPCAKPSAMPAYDGVMTPQEMADVLAFLQRQWLARRP